MHDTGSRACIWLTWNTEVVGLEYGRFAQASSAMCGTTGAIAARSPSSMPAITV